MSRKLTGTVYQASSKWYARLTIRGQRESISLQTCTDRDSAEKRTALLAGFARRLREAWREDVALQLLDYAAACENDALIEVRRAVELIVTGKVVPTRPGNAQTVRELGERWTRGELAREYPDHVKAKQTSEHDRGRLEKYVYGVIGNVPMDKLTIDHALLVMRRRRGEDVSDRARVFKPLQVRSWLHGDLNSLLDARYIGHASR